MTGCFRIRKYSGALASVILLLQTISGQEIRDYTTFTGWGVCKKDSAEVIVLRKYLKEGVLHYLTVLPGSFVTRIITSDSIIVTGTSWKDIKSRYYSTPYIRAANKSEFYSGPLQDAGYKKFLSSQKGIDLTIDLCPSHLPLDRIIFIDLIRELGKVEKPVPLSISITGIWIRDHFSDFKWLDSLDRAGELSIVWINHSFNHHTFKNIPLKQNFMLAPGTDIDSEVLKTEIVLLQNNLLPSVFFRFPGLVSDREIFDRILNLGLIPVGSDSWLAKGQWPTNGSIVLVHANGNEPLGIRDFIRLLKKEQPEVSSKRWELYDLRESMADDNLR